MPSAIRAVGKVSYRYCIEKSEGRRGDSHGFSTNIHTIFDKNAILL